MAPTVRLGRIAGIEVRLHWSVLVIMLLFTWSLADATLPSLVDGSTSAAYWVAALLAVVVFFASLLAHEFAHSLVARRCGVVVDSITLWLLGGVSQLHGDMQTPRDELRIAAAGPLTSLGLGAAFGLLALAISVTGGPDLAVAAIGWLGALNIMLAIFNLVPGAPLDGGRLLHAWVWHRTGDRAAATAAAARAGARVGYSLIGLGLVLLLLGDLAAAWFVLLGWFLLSASQAEATDALVRTALANVRVRDVMTESPTTVSAAASVAALVDDWFIQRGCSAFPVVDECGEVTGLVTLRAVRSIGSDRWEGLTAGEVADPRDTLATGSPGEPLTELLPRMSASTGGAGRALVFDDDGRLVGIVSPSDVQRAIERAALRAAPPVARSTRSGRSSGVAP